MGQGKVKLGGKLQIRITWIKGLTVMTEKEEGRKASELQKQNKKGMAFLAPGFKEWGSRTTETLEKGQPTRPRVPPEVLGPGSGTPFPAGHSVVEGARHELLLIKLHCCTSVGLDAIHALSCAHIPQLCRQVIWPFKGKTDRWVRKQTLKKENQSPNHGILREES